ncbi:cold-shock protein [Sphingorhabdus sp. EL138]|jgi:CspA family cold shock protein|uniref:cold-shock protein n=1 Tax=Sphingorhabdus sp. EL138 TaxID=2073156 RepID=UPI000D69C3ED|nr:cold-shock protein [Sphingorhabdus sp. EL138]
MGFDRNRRGRGRDKRDSFGDENFDGYQGDSGPPVERYTRPDTGYSGGQRGGGHGGGHGGGMPDQVVGESTGKVKFFNAQKGFGFIVQDTGGDDVFVHISQVERAGLKGLAEGQGLRFSLVDRGGKVSASDIQIEGDLIEAPEPVAREDRGGPPQRELTGEKASGTVKFFNSMKGFGFIQRDDGQPDAFVHISAVERAGMSGLEEGDKLEFELEVDRRGKTAAVNLVSK